MLLNVTLEYMKFLDTDSIAIRLIIFNLNVTLELIKARCRWFVNTIMRQDASFAPLSLLNCYFFTIIIRASLARRGMYSKVGMNYETSSFIALVANDF